MSRVISSIQYSKESLSPMNLQLGLQTQITLPYLQNDSTRPVVHGLYHEGPRAYVRSIYAKL